MSRRDSKPKPPSTAALDAAILAFLPIVQQEKAARKWPDNSQAGDVLEALHRLEQKLIQRPDHPRHQDWLDAQTYRSSPGAVHRG